MNFIKKEMLIALRSWQIQIASLIIILLLIVAGVSGYQNYTTQQSQIKVAQHEKRDQWLNQGNKHPHIASHFGTFVFKPKTALSFFDFGIDAYTGAFIYLEAHYQHDFMFRQAQDYSAMIRFGELSISLVLQLLIPLLIIFLCFATFTEERNQGTLKILISQGVCFRKIVWSKIATYTIFVFALLIPAVFLLMSALLFKPQFEFTSDILLRCTLLTLCYALYFFIFICLSIWVSSWAYSSGNALLLLLFLWVLLSIVIPKFIANQATKAYQLPSKANFEVTIKSDLDNKLKRELSKDKLIIDFTQQLFRQYKVNRIADLPFNYEAACAQVYEDFSNEVHDRHATKLTQNMINQNKLSSYASVLNPFLAIRNLSMAMCGTDFYTYVDFQNAAESYRRKMVRQLNLDYRDHSKTGEFYEYKAGKKLWVALEDFNYQIPKGLDGLRNYWIELFSLFFWTLGLMMGITKFVNKSAL
jgi:ABC-2 type transport system permease protein